MIAKISNGTSLFGAISYNQEKVDKANARVIFSQNIIQNTWDDDRLNMHYAMKSFEPYLIANKKTEKPVVHISLNPDPKDTLSDKQYAQLAQDYMQKMGFENQPYLVFKHEDIDRHHIHLVTVRVREDGTKINDSFEHRRSMDVCRELEQKYNLLPAEKHTKEQAYQLRKVDYAKGDVKRQIGNTVKELTKTYQFQSVNEFRALLSLFNVTVEEVKGEVKGKSYNGIVYSALNEKGEKIGNPFNSSLFDKSVGYVALQKKCEKSKEQWKNSPSKNAIKKTVSDMLKQSAKPEQFQKLLQKQHLDVIFRQNETGRIYGATFIDHENRCVFNGSRLGKEFSANAFEEYFKSTPQQSREISQEQHAGKYFSGTEFTKKHSTKEEQGDTLGGLFSIIPNPDESFFPKEEKFKPYRKKKKRKKLK